MEITRKFRPALLAAALAGAAAADEIDPGELRHWSMNSMTIMETFRHYQEEFEERRRKRFNPGTGELENQPRAFLIMLDFNAVSPMTDSGNLASVRTSEGEFRSVIQKSYGAANLSYLGDDGEFGGYIILEDLGLTFGHRDLPPDKQYLMKGRGSNEVFGPSSGFIIPALFWRSPAWEMHLGALMRLTPKIADSAGVKVFLLEEDEFGTYEAVDQTTRLFLNGRWRGYSLNTLIGIGDLEYAGLAFEPGDFGGVSISPFLRYASYRRRTQVGARFRKTFREFYSSHVEAAGDLHRKQEDGRFGFFYHLDFETRRTFRKLPRSRLSEFSGYDFHFVLDYGMSLSTSMLDAFAAGFAWGVALEDMLGLVSLRLGGGMNDYDYLRVFPLRDTYVMDMRLQVAY